jgi:spore germination cell wall hydrolase CwlJ-like protein
MVASRVRVIGASYSARFWLSAFCAALMPTSIGYQDLAALIAHQPGAASDWHMIASPFGTVQAATFSYTRPVGTAIPEPIGFQNVNFDPRSLDAFAWKIDEPMSAQPSRQIEYPLVNRENKGDRLPVSTMTPAASEPASLPQLQPISAPSAPAARPLQAPAPVVAPQSGNAGQHVEDKNAAPPVVQMDAHADAPAAASPAPAAASAVDAPSAAPPAADDDISLADKPPEIPAPGETTEAPSTLDQMSFIDGNSGDRSAEIYFGNGSLGSPEGLQSWAPGAEPILVPPAEQPGFKLSSLEETDTDTDEAVAGKDNSRVLSPAQQLGLEGKPRAKAEKCLADAVYFEARGEVMKGQEAVAQVVMNRVFSGVYPHDVCGVVYQNAGRHLACQFTFACEGKDLDRKDEPDMWEQAKQIAKDTLDGKIWLAEVGHATHYHAYWVHPSWVHEMAKLYHLGVHTFYRPLNWGNGDDEPVWGQGPANVGVRLDPEVLNGNPEPAPRSPEATVKGPEASVSPAPAADKTATAKL